LKGGKVIIPALDKPKDTYEGLNELFGKFLKSEICDDKVN
jgi:ferritin